MTVERKNNINYGKHFIDDEDIRAVVEVLGSDFLTQGPKVGEFETRVSEIVGATFTASFNSATSALHCACLALGVEKNDVVWTSAISFVASANCALYCNADVDFVDIDPSTFNLSITDLSKKLKFCHDNKLKLPKVVIAVHMCGNPCDMRSLKLLSNEYNFRIIEDASHALGSKHLGEFVGNCKYSDITVFSYHPVKNITTGEGGTASTNDPILFKKLKQFSSHGIVKSQEDLRKKSEWSLYYEQQTLGFNYRMTDISAALGISQLSKLDGFISDRNVLANEYNNFFSHKNVRVQTVSDFDISAYHIYIVLLSSKSERFKLFNFLKQKDIHCSFHYPPIYSQPYYRNLAKTYMPCPNADEYADRALTIPLYPSMSLELQSKVMSAIEDYGL